MMKIIQIFLITILLGSCMDFQDENDDREIQQPEYIKWEIELPNDEVFITVHNPMVNDDLVIIPVDNQGVILALDKASGEEVWRWKEARDTYDGADGFGMWNYIYDDILMVGQNNILYAIDVNSGSTLWHERNELSSNNNFFGHEGMVGINFRIPNEMISYQLLDVQTSELKEVVEFNREDIYNMSGNGSVLYSYNDKTYMAFVQKKWLSSENGYEEYGWLYNYNITDEQLEWVSDTIPKNSPILHVPGHPYIQRGKIVLASNSIQAYDIESGYLDWIDQTHTNTFTWSTGLTAANGKVFGNNENGYMIALDVDTGAELWRTDTGGTGSRIEYYDEKLYISQITGYFIKDENRYADGSSLLVLDANNGEILHHLEAPYQTPDNHQYWDDVITVDQETGLIYTADHNKMMCIELED